MATLAELETALVNAHKAGDADAARKLAKVIIQERQRREGDPSYLIPGAADEAVPGTIVPEPESTLTEQAVGVGEVGLSTVTGMTSGLIGLIGGTLKGLAEELASGQYGTMEAADRVEQAAMKGAERLTYAPRTKTGQEYLETIGEVTEPLVAATPLAPELGMVAQSARAAAPIVRGATVRAAQPIVQATKQAADKVKALPEMIRGEPEAAPGTGTSAGAAAVDKGTQREMASQELPVPIQLTEGQKTRTFEQQRFERETAKLPDVGSPLRERFRQQNEQLQQNMDAFIDETGAQLGEGNLRGIGELVDETLRARAAKDKTKIRTLYKEAEKAGEMEEPVNLQALVDALNESRSAESTAPVLGAARRELLRLGGAIEDEDGNLTLATITGGQTRAKNAFLQRLNDALEDAEDLAEAKEIFNDFTDQYRNEFNDNDISRARIKNIAEEGGGPYFQIVADAQGFTKGLSLKDAEQLRKFVNKVTGNDPTNVKFAADIKRAIDAATEGKGGEKYQQARKARAKYSKDYENVALVKRLLGTKRGSEDRAIAMEDVLRKVVLDPSTSLDQMLHVRRLLQTKTGGPEGQGAQAWRELRGGVLRHIQEQMTKGVSRDEAGNPIVSPAQLDRVITQLDRSGKLDFIFGKQGSEQLRLLNEVAKDVLTSPPGTVNTSNTATVLAGLMDVAISGTAGVPAPVATTGRMILSSIRDAKLRKRVQKALGEDLEKRGK